METEASTITYFYKNKESKKITFDTPKMCIFIHRYIIKNETRFSVMKFREDGAYQITLYFK